MPASKIPANAQTSLPFSQPRGLAGSEGSSPARTLPACELEKRYRGLWRRLAPGPTTVPGARSSNNGKRRSLGRDDNLSGDNLAVQRSTRLSLLHRETTLQGLPAMLAVNPELFAGFRSEEHTSELQSLLRISSAVFSLKNTTQKHNNTRD